MQQTQGKNESDFGNIDSQNRNDNEEESKKGHRRSKNDTEGRTYKCKQCGKSYLSYPALSNHCKKRHNTCNNGEFNTERARYNPLEASYFLKENRKLKITGTMLEKAQLQKHLEKIASSQCITTKSQNFKLMFSLFIACFFVSL